MQNRTQGRPAVKSDAQLKLDVMAELDWDPSIDATRIGIEVRNGVVTLAGHVDTFAEKWDAERAAQRVDGVQALAVEIDVALPGSSMRTDSDIAQAAQNVLLWTATIPGEAIKVMVEGGWISLSGEVEWEFQRQIATSLVRRLMGVTGVSNNIGIRSRASSGAVKSDIEAALKRRGTTDSGRIAVDVQGSDVTLTGVARNWSERERARHAAWSAAGVSSVVDRMTIAG